MLKIIVVVACLTILEACNHAAPVPTSAAYDPVLKSQRNDSLYQWVGKKHDDIMPRDADIERYIFTLRQQLAADSLRRDTILPMLSALNTAHEGMMDWMHHFKNTELDVEYYQSLPESGIWDYLHQQEKAIEEVTQQMLSSIQRAETFLHLQPK